MTVCTRLLPARSITQAQQARGVRQGTAYMRGGRPLPPQLMRGFSCVRLSPEEKRYIFDAPYLYFYK